MSHRGVTGPDRTAISWDNDALARFLEAQWLKRGLDQTTFLQRAELSIGWLTNLRANTNRKPSLEAMAKLRTAYQLDIDLMLDILEGRVTVDGNGNVKRGAR
jgi:hypothetical protein